MKKLIKFPSIEQFRTVVTNVNRHYNFVGVDENGDAIYDQSKPKPKLTFKGTVKLHGTNGGVCFNTISGLWAQSRENIITPEQDNAGFAFFVQTKNEDFLRLMSNIANKHDIDPTRNTISIFGEWCGGNIQKGVAISQLPKMFVIFGVKISPIVDQNDEEAVKNNPAYWVDSKHLRDTINMIFNIEDFKTYEIEIDFNAPQLAQNKLIELTDEVERECPVGITFGFSGIGEGIVWSCEVNGVVHRFKVKGEKHAGKSKTKTLAPVDDEKIRKVMEVADQVTPTWRLQQMLEQACNFMNGGTLDRAKLGEFIKLVMQDIIKEESDILAEAGLEPKDIGKYVSENAKRYFFEQETV